MQKIDKPDMYYEETDCDEDKELDQHRPLKLWMVQFLCELWSFS